MFLKHEYILIFIFVVVQFYFLADNISILYFVNRMMMEPVTSDHTKTTEKEPYVDLTKPISNWFKPSEKLNSPQTKVVGSEKLVDKTNTLCKSIIGCASMTLKGFEFCHKHILEDKNSPFRRCSFISKSDYRRCRNPTPILGKKFYILWNSCSRWMWMIIFLFKVCMCVTQYKASVHFGQCVFAANRIIVFFP